MPMLYRNPTLASGRVAGTGWLAPMPDLRDYNPDTESLQPILAKLKIATMKAGTPARIDLRQWCSPIEDQGGLGSCTANAAVGAVEYFERRAFNKHIDGSRLFIYKSTRNLMGVTGDTGAWLRNTMGALALCGVAPEKYWPYTDAAPDFDQEPGPFIYAVADNYEALKYYCHDPLGANIPGADVLASVKRHLAAGVPAIFGFWGFPSFNDSDTPGGIPMPCANEQAQWGHAIVAVGYDDAKRITNTRCNQTTRGALLIRNSWGTEWGDQGYGWMPYDYVRSGLALDFWSLLNMEWVNTGNFGV